MVYIKKKTYLGQKNRLGEDRENVRGDKNMPADANFITLKASQNLA
ncbi:hypothetical protein ELAC_2174 [Estrella lausannensis]|uniref:Uncharacterized protein n=1 Tax=Estrella lausannensis TaxID=483423 RepID=A0A0H5DU94_9BACT|nr:hypothetical protein ELAC_2174 [Estrella lausannensis]